MFRTTNYIEELQSMRLEDRTYWLGSSGLLPLDPNTYSKIYNTLGFSISRGLGSPLVYIFGTVEGRRRRERW